MNYASQSKKTDTASLDQVATGKNNLVTITSAAGSLPNQKAKANVSINSNYGNNRLHIIEFSRTEMSIYMLNHARSNELRTVLDTQKRMADVN
jgi:hypothetical protein